MRHRPSDGFGMGARRNWRRRSPPGSEERAPVILGKRSGRSSGRARRGYNKCKYGSGVVLNTAARGGTRRRPPAIVTGAGGDMILVRPTAGSAVRR
ncbi:hypothetical protein M6B38_172895 [Iris pallida]|uniref:Uncharacterized protein n=1 Tax=Iris pallida TaxID=29817 RepID=A0AAX6ETZ9_IRIPA|nr:hypothetical protein M6B38_172895 [Iris pallida]